MAQPTSTSTTVTRPETVSGATRSPDSVRPHYYTTFQSNCCDSKINTKTTATATQNKDLLPIPKKIKAEAEEVLNRIHGVLIEELTEIAQHTSIIPDIFLETNDTFNVQRFLIDRVVLKTLNDAHIINWNVSIKQLYPIRTSGNGNCLLHAVLIAMVGIHDSNLYLRDRLAQFMDENKDLLRNHWRIERLKSDKNYGIRSEDSKLNDEWDELCDLVHYEKSEDGQTASHLPYLEAVHIFSISNMLRRPIIILSEDVIRNKNGEAISVNDLFGIYLPILAASTECIKEPIVLVYDHSHFCPLQTNESRTEKATDNLLPLYQSISHTYDQTLLPIRFLGDDISTTRSETLLYEYLQTRKIKYNYDASSSPLSILCAELGSRHVSPKADFLLLYHKYLIDFFQVQKPAVIEEERKREKQRELDNYVSRQTSNDTSGWPLLRDDSSSSVLQPVISSRSATSVNSRQTRNSSNPSSRQRYVYDGIITDNVYIPTNGAVHIEKSPSQLQQSNKPSEPTKTSARDPSPSHALLNQSKQTNSSNSLDNIDKSSRDEKTTTTRTVNRQDNSQRSAREHSRLRISYEKIQPNIIPNNHQSRYSDRNQDSVFDCLLCDRPFYGDSSAVYCPKCDSSMQQYGFANVVSSRPSTRSKPAERYPSAYSIGMKQADKSIMCRRILCPSCKSLNLYSNQRSTTGYHCSACQYVIIPPTY